MPKRRRDWLLGRWTAKNLVRAYLSESGAVPAQDTIVIRAHADGSPYASTGAEPLPFGLSISHSGETSFCALTRLPEATVGADIEIIEPRPISLAKQFFSQDELTAVLARPASERDLLITLVWSAKEAFLKCVKEGLRVDTRAVAVEVPLALPQINVWQPLEVTARPDLLRPGSAYQAWWRHTEEYTLTLGLLTGPRP